MESNATKQLVWTNILFFGITSFLAIFVLPVYAIKFGLKPVDWILFAFMAVSTMMATTFGYHRLFAHKAFKAHPVLEFLNLFFGAATFGGSALGWASEHRDHHKYTDTPHDPYNIGQGFWHAHMGWFLTWRYKVDFDNVKDLSSNKWVMHQHKHYLLWSVGTGIVMPIVIGTAFGSFWGAALLAVCGRLFFIHQSIFMINSACHTFGKQTYDLKGSARDSFFNAILTHGEGYHSYHHRFPSDYRNGVRWYHWDPTKWLIKFYSFFGLCTELKRIPEAKIIAVRAEVERELMHSKLKASSQAQALIHNVQEKLEQAYQGMLESCKQWEQAALKFKSLKQNNLKLSPEVIQNWKQQISQLRINALEARKLWLGVFGQYSKQFA